MVVWMASKSLKSTEVMYALRYEDNQEMIKFFGLIIFVIIN